MDGQISIFQVMDQYETERLPYEACKAGVIAWTIECAAITNSWDTAAPVMWITAKPRKIRFKRDSKKDCYGWCTYYDSIDSGNYFGGGTLGWTPSRRSPPLRTASGTRGSISGRTRGSRRRRHSDREFGSTQCT